MAPYNARTSAVHIIFFFFQVLLAWFKTKHKDMKFLLVVQNFISCRALYVC